MAKAEFAIDFCFMSYHDTQKAASESVSHKFRLEHVADICLLPSKLKTCRTSAISRFILITRLVSLIFIEIRPLFTPSFDSISPKKCQKSRPMKSIKIPSRSLSHPLAALGEVLRGFSFDGASPNEGRNQGKNRREGKALKIVYFYDLYTHQTI